ncbi:MAG: hypothetical protein ACLRTQ_00950 [Candidatus Borkfalkia sp.]
MNEDIEVYNDFKASEPILKVRNLKKYFPVGGIGKNKKYLRAVDTMSFDTRLTSHRHSQCKRRWGERSSLFGHRRRREIQRLRSG